MRFKYRKFYLLGVIYCKWWLIFCRYKRYNSAIAGNFITLRTSKKL